MQNNIIQELGIQIANLTIENASLKAQIAELQAKLDSKNGKEEE